jgi:CDGSH-type Zn-finger protein
MSGQQQGGPRVAVSKNGPHLVTGGVPLATQSILGDPERAGERWQEGAAFRAQDSYALCRCGHSAGKPFCDGAHAAIGFRASQ